MTHSCRITRKIVQSSKPHKFGKVYHQKSYAEICFANKFGILKIFYSLNKPNGVMISGRIRRCKNKNKKKRWPSCRQMSQ